MAFIQIPNLPAVIGLAGDELFEGVQAGTSVKISLNQIIAATRSGLPTTLPIPVILGGTGVSTLTGYVKGSGTSPFTASATIPNTDITGLGTMSVQDANAVAITGGSVTGITDITVSDGGTGVSTLTGYVQGSGTSPLTASITIPVSDITGLGTMATQNANAVAVTGGTINGTTVGATIRAAVSATTLNANDASVISVSSASAALTVTQTGAGAAILVEDETSPDSTPFIVDATGNVGIGTSTLTGLLNLYAASNATLYVSGDAATSIVAARSSSDTISASVNFRKYRGTTAVPTAVASGDVLGTSNYTAWDGATLRVSAQIVGTVDTFAAANDVSSFLTFLTRPSGVAAPVTERLRIASAGQIGIGGANYGTTGQTIVSAGAAAAPAWGVLPVTGGGTGVTTSTGSGAVVLDTGPTITGAALNGTVGATTPSTGVFTTLSDAAGNVRDIVNNAKVAAYILALTDNGEMINITTGGVTVNSGIFSAGNNVTIYNNSAASQTITQGAGVTLRLAGSATTGNRTLALRGICTIVCVASNEFVVSGAGVT